MNIRDLKYLLAIIEHKHFGKAAQACFVSQPTLSAQLKKLEEELGVQLFERSNKQVITTPQGVAIAEQAKRVLQEFEQLKAVAACTQDPYAGQFRLGIIPTLSAYLLPYILPDLHTHFNRLELLLYEDKTDSLLSKLKEGALEAIIIATPFTDKNYETKLLFKEEFLAALPNSHPLAKTAHIKFQMLEHESVLLLEEGHCLQDQVADICQNHGIKTNINFRATSLETLRYMVAAGTGITLMPALAAKSTPNICAYKPLVQPTPYRELLMVWRKQSVKKLVCNALGEFINHTMSQVL